MSDVNEERRETRWRNWLRRLSPAAAEVQESWQRQDARERLSPTWFLVEIPDGEDPVLHECESAEQIAARIKELDDSETVVFAFCGLQAPISQPPYRYLMLPGGLNLPAFVQPGETPVEPDEGGYLGRELNVPAELNVRRPDDPPAARFRGKKKAAKRSEYEYDEEEPL